MPQRDDLSPEQLEALIDGHSPDVGDDAPFAALVSDLRATDEASPELRARVRDIVQPRKSLVGRMVERVRAMGFGQRALAFAPVAVLVVGVVFAVSSITRGSEPLQPVGSAPSAAGSQEERLAAPAPVEDAAAPQAPLAKASLTIRVAGPSAVAAAGRRTRAIAAEKGGRTIRESYSRPAEGPQSASITLEVPPDQWNDTRTALSKLGEVSGESALFGAPDTAASPPAISDSTDGTPPTATITVTFVTP